MAKEVIQALVAIGGKAQRLRTAGVEVPISKSFLNVLGEPLLHWNLTLLYRAGIRRLVLCGDKTVQLDRAELVLKRLNLEFAEVHLVQDPGLGVHGLPYQVRANLKYRLDEAFIFECGHSLMRPEHYRKLVTAKRGGRIVFSAFKSHPSNSRQPVALERTGIRLLESSGPGKHALAHPFLVDHSYVDRLPELDFDIRRIIGYYAGRGELDYIFSKMPPEFDVVEEFRAAQSSYEIYLCTFSGIRRPADQVGTLRVAMGVLRRAGRRCRKVVGHVRCPWDGLLRIAQNWWAPVRVRWTISMNAATSATPSHHRACPYRSRSENRT